MAFDSLHAISSRIWEEIQGGWIFDDERVNVKLIRDLIHVYRANIIESLAQTKLSLSTAFYQECCVEIECREACSGAPVKEEYIKLPSLIGTGAHSIKYLGTVDRKISFERRESFSDYTASFPFKKTSKSPYFVLVNNNEAIIKNKPTASASKLIVLGLFSNPLACKGNCDLESPYPVPSTDVIKTIEEMVLKRLAAFMIQRRVDKQHNANPDT